VKTLCSPLRTCVFTPGVERRVKVHT
jgi:hypothetical protein